MECLTVLGQDLQICGVVASALQLRGCAEQCTRNQLTSSPFPRFPPSSDSFAFVSSVSAERCMSRSVRHWTVEPSESARARRQVVGSESMDRGWGRKGAMVRPNGSKIGCSLGAWHENRDMTAELLGWKEGLRFAPHTRGVQPSNEKENIRLGSLARIRFFHHAEVLGKENLRKGLCQPGVGWLCSGWWSLFDVPRTCLELRENNAIQNIAPSPTS